MGGSGLPRTGFFPFKGSLSYMQEAKSRTYLYCFFLLGGLPNGKNQPLISGKIHIKKFVFSLGGLPKVLGKR